jgi:hypothetical protein
MPSARIQTTSPLRSDGGPFKDIDPSFTALHGDFDVSSPSHR